MGCIDKLLEFCANATITTSTGTNNIGQTINLGAPGILGTENTSNFPGPGEEMWLIVKTGLTEIAAASPGTFQVQLVSHPTDPPSTTTAKKHVLSPALVTDVIASNDNKLNAGGLIFACALPADTYNKIVGIQTVVGGVALTQGTLSAFLTREPGIYVNLPDSLPTGS